MDDMLLAAESILAILWTKLEITFQSTRTNNFIALFSGIASFGVFLLYSIKFIRDLNKDFRRLMTLLLTVPIKEITKIELTLSAFLDLLTNDYDDAEYAKRLDTDQINVVVRPKHHQVISGKKGSLERAKNRMTRKPDLTGIYTKDLFSLLQTLVGVSIILAAMIIYFLKHRPSLT